MSARQRPGKVKAAEVAPTSAAPANKPPLSSAAEEGSGTWHQVTEAFLFVLFTALSFFTRFYKLTTPNLVLFDEVHFGKFVNSHLTGHFYFDIHPPLVKLVMAALLRFTTDYQGTQPFENIGEAINETTPLFTFRFIPALAGSLIVPAVFLISRRLRFSLWTTFLCSSMVCFDNLLLGESREILTDSCMILFICTSILSHLSAEQQPLFSHGWYLWTTATGISLGCALSTKWTSLSVFGIIGISTIVDLGFRFGTHSHRKYSKLHLRDFFTRAGLLLGIPLVIYVTCFYFYFITLPKSGPGDAFMTREFQSTLEGSKMVWHGPKPTFWDNFFALNAEMFRANKNVATPHHWQSYWYTWPFNWRGIACWNGPVFHEKDESGNYVQMQAFVYLLGNPFVWWFSSICLVLSPFVIRLRGTGKSAGRKARVTAIADPNPLSPTSEFPNRFEYLLMQLYTGWVTSILPYALISRACFIYHYMPSLIFAILITGVVFDILFTHLLAGVRGKLYTVTLLVSVFVWAFWFWAPFSYGDPMTEQENRSRRWFESWY